MATIKELTDQFYDLMENVYNTAFSLKQLKEQVQEQLTVVEADIAKDKAGFAPEETDEGLDEMIEYEDSDAGNQKIKEKNALDDLDSDIYALISKLEND